MTLKRITQNMTGQEAADTIYNNDNLFTSGKQLTDYNFPLLCISSSVKASDIIISKESDTLLNVEFTKELFFYFKTKDSNSNYLQSVGYKFEIPITPLPIAGATSIITFGLIFNPLTAHDRIGHRFSYILVPAHDKEPLLADGEVFAPILTISNVATSTPKMTAGAIYDKIYIREPIVNYGFHVDVASNDLTENDFIIQKDVDEEGTPVLKVEVKRQLIYNTKLGISDNYVYPPAQNMVIPLVPARTSVIQIGIVFSPSNITAPSRCRYDYILSPNKDNIANPVLTEGEVFAPVLTITGAATTNPKMVAGKIYDKIINEKVKILENTIKAQNVNKSNPLVYSIDFQSTDLSEWSNEFINVSDGVQLNANKYYWLKRLYRINKRAFEFDFNTSTASKFAVYTHGLENGLAGTDTLFFTVDITNGILTLSYNNTSVNYPFVANKDYRIRITQVDRVLGIKVIDIANGTESDELTYKGVSSNTGLLYDSLSFYFDTGVSPIFKKFIIYSLVKNPKIIFFGDSITVGYTSTIVDGLSKNGYAQLCGDAMNVPYLTSGRGGGTALGFLGEATYIGRFFTELAILKPDFAMVTIGTNGGHDYNTYKQIVDTIQSYGVVPILNNIPLRDGASYVSTTNAAINQIRREYGISGARFDLASSLNNDGVTFDPSLFVSDKVHPNDLLHLAMFNRIELDVPEIF